MVRNVVVWNSWKTTLLAALILGFNIFDGLHADGNIGKLIHTYILYIYIKGKKYQFVVLYVEESGYWKYRHNYV